MMAARTTNIERMPRLILGAMFVAGGLLTVLSFSLLGQSPIKSKFDGLVERAISTVSGEETRAR
jgi:hypothetical protein